MKCSIMSYDYLDKDVWLNVSCFYASSGYRVLRNRYEEAVDLLVILRGWPRDPERGYKGRIHVYDYVKELTIDWDAVFPCAEEIVLVTLESIPPSGRIRPVKGYLPVIPEIWQRRSRQRCRQPVHISNFKPIQGDSYQRDLLHLIRSGRVRVFGNKWDRVGVKTRMLTYWEANRLLSRSDHCYGLMYPYQRGRTLSGRMWQAPLSGCRVISESNTNITGCPGVIEVSAYSERSLPRGEEVADPEVLRRAAALHWKTATDELAQLLGLPARSEAIVWRVCWARWLLLQWHVQFLRDQLFTTILSPGKRMLRTVRRVGGRFVRRFI